MFRFIRKMLNRLRGVPLVLACLAGCAGEVTTDCDTVLAECVAACPENQAPGATARDACEAGCQTEHSLCVVPVPEYATSCLMHPDNASYVCNGEPAPGGLASGRVCTYLGEWSDPAHPQHWQCQ